jgi:hypothetical protein
MSLTSVRRQRENALSSEAYVIIKQNEYMRKFRNAGATDPMRARPLAELRIKPDRIFRRMQDKDIFKPGRTPESFYIDENAAEEFVAARRRRAYYLMLLVIVIAALMFFLVRR